MIAGPGPREEPMYPTSPQLTAQVAQEQIAERLRDAESRRLANAFGRPRTTGSAKARPRRTWRLRLPRPALG